MAGLTAGALAAEQGARVVVLERGSEVGGSAAFSGGFIWTKSQPPDLNLANMSETSDLALEMRSEFPNLIRWFRSLGVLRSDSHEPATFNDAAGHSVDLPGYFSRCVELITRAGGRVVFRADTSRLQFRRRVMGCTGNVDGEPFELNAHVTILATGGFQANPHLRARYLPNGAEDLLVRSNPRSTGTGLELGQQVGAGLSEEMGGFYGHLIASPVSDFGPRDFMPLAQLHANRALLLDRTGHRFMDESEGHSPAARLLLDLPGRRALLVGDATTRDAGRQPPAPNMEEIDQLVAGRNRGCRTVETMTLQELVTAVAPWGYNSIAVARSIGTFNRGPSALAASGIPRTRTYAPIQDPPFFAIEVQPAITFTYGGLRIDRAARVLRPDGTPISGLLAAGADAGGVHTDEYLGGLAAAAVFGCRAAQSACQDLALAAD
jgi:succinate dehydrogenase/fumarate reductase flavoprotein subunit